jgi:hypothetical protein
MYWLEEQVIFIYLFILLLLLLLLFFKQFNSKMQVIVGFILKKKINLFRVF